MLRRWALAKFSARASKESRWASAISRAVRAVLSTFFAVASTVYLHGCKCLLLYSYHTYIRCQILRRSALPIALIHRSAWKGDSRKFALIGFCELRLMRVLRSLLVVGVRSSIKIISST